MHIQQVTGELFWNTNENDTQNSLQQFRNAAEKLCELLLTYLLHGAESFLSS